MLKVQEEIFVNDLEGGNEVVLATVNDDKWKYLIFIRDKEGNFLHSMYYEHEKMALEDYLRTIGFINKSAIFEK